MNNDKVTLNRETNRFEKGGAMVIKPQQVETEPEGEVEELEPVEELPEEENGYCAQIRELFTKGYSGKDIISMGYSKSTVIMEGRKFFKKNEGTIMGGKNGGNTGNGAPALPAKLGRGDSIPLEVELRNIHIDGDEKYRGGVIDGMRLILIGARLNQMLISGLSETTASQLALLKEAKSDSKEVAQETVLEILPHFTEMIKEASRASSPNPMGSMFARMMEGPLTQAMSGMMGMFGAKQPQGKQEQSLPTGWQDETGKGGQ